MVYHGINGTRALPRAGGRCCCCRCILARSADFSRRYRTPSRCRICSTPLPRLRTRTHAFCLPLLLRTSVRCTTPPRTPTTPPLYLHTFSFARWWIPVAVYAVVFTVDYAHTTFATFTPPAAPVCFSSSPILLLFLFGRCLGLPVADRRCVSGSYGAIWVHAWSMGVGRYTTHTCLPVPVPPLCHCTAAITLTAYTASLPTALSYCGCICRCFWCRRRHSSRFGLPPSLRCGSVHG